MRRPNSILALLAILGCIAPARPFTSDYYDFAGTASEHRMKWATKTIRVSLSSSLTSPGSGIKPDSDVLGAVRRALGRWSMAVDIKFEEASSKVQSISPISGGDGISLITIAETPENLAIMGAGINPARTRVFYDPETGEISEADIAINPQPLSAEGVPLQFSTDGTAGTYDLESTITHEVGHLLGLDHTRVIGATMQSRQSVNGTYKLSAFTERTLSEDDRIRVAGLYGIGKDTSAIEGKLTNNFVAGGSSAVPGAHIWVEDTASGRVIASTITSGNGTYRIEGIKAGQYRVLAEYVDGQRPFRSAEISNQVRANANTTTTLNFVMVPPQNAPPLLKPRFIGTNGELSTTPVIAEAGSTLTVFVGGEGVDQIPISGISLTSPFMAVDAESLTLHQFGTPYPVISFDVHVAPHATFGDYSIRLQANSGEVAYVAGAVTIDPGVNFSSLNPVDDPQFFIAQHYRDFLGRATDPERAKSWIQDLENCGSDMACISDRRIDVSAAFLETEFLETWSYIYRLYKVALGRRPTLAEFNRDKSQITSDRATLENNRRAFARSLVLRPEFLRKYSPRLKADQFVDLLLSSVSQVSQIDLSSERVNLAALHDGTSAGRAEIIQLAAANTSVAEKENGQALALLPYFGYLRREPDEAGLQSWSHTFAGEKTSHPSSLRAMVCSFITSSEYQSRFGMFATHSNKECQLSL